MKLKYISQIAAGKLTGNQCENCKYNRHRICRKPKNKECCKRTFPVHWEKK